MRLTAPRLICTGKPEPYAWQKQERNGIIYRVEVSDGTGNIRINCHDEAVYAAFIPFQAFSVDLDVSQNNRSGDIYITAVGVAPSK